MKDLMLLDQMIGPFFAVLMKLFLATRSYSIDKIYGTQKAAGYQRQIDKIERSSKLRAEREGDDGGRGGSRRGDGAGGSGGSEAGDSDEDDDYEAMRERIRQTAGSGEEASGSDRNAHV